MAHKTIALTTELRELKSIPKCNCACLEIEKHTPFCATRLPKRWFPFACFPIGCCVPVFLHAFTLGKKSPAEGFELTRGCLQRNGQLDASTFLAKPCPHARSNRIPTNRECAFWFLRDMLLIILQRFVSMCFAMLSRIMLLESHARATTHNHARSRRKPEIARRAEKRLGVLRV